MIGVDKLIEHGQIIHWVLIEYLYIKPDIYNGLGSDSPTLLGQWNLESPDAYQQLRAAGVDYVLVSPQQESAMMQGPLAPKLRMVYDDGQGEVLFRLEPAPVGRARSDFQHAPPSSPAAGSSAVNRSPGRSHSASSAGA